MQGKSRTAPKPDSWLSKILKLFPRKISSWGHPYFGFTASVIPAIRRWDVEISWGTRFRNELEARIGRMVQQRGQWLISKMVDDHQDERMCVETPAFDMQEPVFSGPVSPKPRGTGRTRIKQSASIWRRCGDAFQNGRWDGLCEIKSLWKSLEQYQNAREMKREREREAMDMMTAEYQAAWQPDAPRFHLSF
jgi:hypothetical protein